MVKYIIQFRCVFVISLRSGILDTRRMLDLGIKIGLGTGKLLCIIHKSTKLCHPWSQLCIIFILARREARRS